MELTFIGHQGWLLSHRSTHVLLDPVLDDRFGHSPHVDFRVYPPRRVDADAMPRPDAIVLSHEHLDHFHLPSLDRLPRNIPVYVGPLLPGCVAHAITALGFRVERVPLFEPLAIGDLRLTLYPGAQDTVFWEKRVTQVHAIEAGAGDGGIYIAVDARLSTEYRVALERGQLPPPRAIVMSNNSQYAPPGSVGAYSNLLPLPDHGRTPGTFPGLSILHSLMLGYYAELGPVPFTILCGNGFVSATEGFGPYLFSDNKRLAEIANELALTRRAYGPYPGERLIVEEAGGIECATAPWIALDREEMDRLLAKQAAFVRAPVAGELVALAPAYASQAEVDAAIVRLEAELVPLARSLLLSRVGVLALATHAYLSGPLGARRILLRLVEGARVHQYALDVNEARFVRDDTPGDEVLTRFPFGVEAHLRDFVAVIDGELQIWDLAGNAMRSWFLGNVYENVVVALLELYGEQVRPDLAARVYARSLAELQARRAGERGEA